MGDLPFMKLWVRDYLVDTADLTTEEHGAYLLLLMALWSRGGRLPMDGARLARIAHLPNERWAEVWSTLLRFFEVNDGQLTQRRLSRELAEAQQIRGANKERAQKAAAARWKNGAAQDAPSNGQAVLRGMPEAMLDDCQSESESERDPDPCADAQDEGFEAFYAAFPRKRARGKAVKAWKKMAKQRPAIEVVIAAVERLKREGREPKYYPYPATWLSDEGWKDEIPGTGAAPNGSASAALAEMTRENAERYR